MNRRTFLKIMGLSAATVAVPAITLNEITTRESTPRKGMRKVATIPMVVADNYLKETGKNLLEDQSAMKEFLKLRKEFNV